MSLTDRAYLILVVLVAVLAVFGGEGTSQTVLAGSAKNATGVLLVVRSDGVENRIQGRGTFQLFEQDTLSTEESQALIETVEGVQVALNSGTVLKLLSRWQKDKGVTRVLRLQKGELWVRSTGSGAAFEVETVSGVVATMAGEVDVRLVSDGEMAATVAAGTADLSTPFATCPLRAGTVSYASRGKACTAPTLVDGRSAIGWTRALLAP